MFVFHTSNIIHIIQHCITLLHILQTGLENTQKKKYYVPHVYTNIHKKAIIFTNLHIITV